MFSEQPITPAQTALPSPNKPATTALRLCVLGSGSGGNSTVIQYRGDAMLIDAGFGPVTTARRLAQVGLGLRDVRALCLTHLDQDHFRPHWVRTLLGWRIPVYCHTWHVGDMLRYDDARKLQSAGLLRTFDGKDFLPIAGLTTSAIPLAHDRKGTFAFHVSADNARIGYATDLGHVPDELVARFASGGGVDLLAIESNYDPPMQLGSNRPLFLKRRIMGMAGHLSNEQAFEFVQQVDRLSGEGNPRHIVLLHRSQQCNCPEKVHEMFSRSPDILRRVALTEQRRRSRWFNVTPQDAMDRGQMNFRF